MNKVTLPAWLKDSARPSGWGVSGFLSRHGKFEQQVADSLWAIPALGQRRCCFRQLVESPHLQATAAKVQNLY